MVVSIVSLLPVMSNMATHHTDDLPEQPADLASREERRRQLRQLGDDVARYVAARTAPGFDHCDARPLFDDPRGTRFRVNVLSRDGNSERMEIKEWRIVRSYFLLVRQKMDRGEMRLQVVDCQPELKT